MYKVDINVIIQEEGEELANNSNSQLLAQTQRALAAEGSHNNS